RDSDRPIWSLLTVAMVVTWAFSCFCLFDILSNAVTIGLRYFVGGILPDEVQDPSLIRKESASRVMFLLVVAYSIFPIVCAAHHPSRARRFGYSLAFLSAGYVVATAAVLLIYHLTAPPTEGQIRLPQFFALPAFSDNFSDNLITVAGVF